MINGCVLTPLHPLGSLSDHAYVMELGEVTMSGKASDLAADPKVVETYLGLAH